MGIFYFQKREKSLADGKIPFLVYEYNPNDIQNEPVAIAETTSYVNSLLGAMVYCLQLENAHSVFRITIIGNLQLVIGSKCHL
jgi:hypothetical protein